MVRAAAKNSAHVAVVVDPADYDAVLEELDAGQGAHRRRRGGDLHAQGLRPHRRLRRRHRRLAGRARRASPSPTSWRSRSSKVQELRYGENPHQRGAFYRGYRAPAEPTVGLRRGAAGQGALVQQPARPRRRAGPGARVSGAARARSSSSTTPRAAWRMDDDAREGLPHGPRGATRSRPSAASSRSTARSTRRPPGRWPRRSSRRSSRPAYSRGARDGARRRRRTCACSRRRQALAVRRRAPRPQLELRSISGRPAGAGPRRGRAQRRVEGGDPARPHRGRARGAALRLAGLQAREEQRHRLLRPPTGCWPSAAGRPAGSSR